MPYIAIKGFPKDDETVRKVAERINATLLELWGCRQEHINISYEAVPPEEWDERIEHGGGPLHRLLLRPDDLCRSGQALRGASRQQLREDQGRGEVRAGRGGLIAASARNPYGEPQPLRYEF